MVSKIIGWDSDGTSKHEQWFEGSRRIVYKESVVGVAGFPFLLSWLVLLYSTASHNFGTASTFVLSSLPRYELWAPLCWFLMSHFSYQYHLRLTPPVTVSVINNASILSFMKVSCRTFTISWNTYCLNDRWQSLSDGRHQIDSSVAQGTKCLTLPNIYAFILSDLLIMLIGYRWLVAALYTLTANECFYSQWYDVHSAWYVVPQCRPLHSGVLKCWLQLASHRVISGSMISRNSKQTAIGQLKTIKHALQMHS